MNHEIHEMFKFHDMINSFFVSPKFPRLCDSDARSELRLPKNCDVGSLKRDL